MSTSYILHADDEAGLTRGYVRKWKDHPKMGKEARHETFLDGEALIERFRELIHEDPLGRYLVIVDRNMGGMPGEEVIASLKEEFSFAKVQFVMLADTTMAVRQRVEELGAVYHSKPDPKDGPVAQIIREFLDAA